MPWCLGHRLPNIISTNQLRKKGAVLQEALRKLKLLTDLKTGPHLESHGELTLRNGRLPLLVKIEQQ